jgi:hypothetical protein
MGQGCGLGGAGRVWAKGMKRRNKKQHYEFIQHMIKDQEQDNIIFV